MKRNNFIRSWSLILFFSSWILWVVLGLLVIVLLAALVMRPRGPANTGSDQCLDV